MASHELSVPCPRRSPSPARRSPPARPSPSGSPATATTSLRRWAGRACRPGRSRSPWWSTIRTPPGAPTCTGSSSASTQPTPSWPRPRFRRAADRPATAQARPPTPARALPAGQPTTTGSPSTPSSAPPTSATTPAPRRRSRPSRRPPPPAGGWLAPTAAERSRGDFLLGHGSYPAVLVRLGDSQLAGDRQQQAGHAIGVDQLVEMDSWGAARRSSPLGRLHGRRHHPPASTRTSPPSCYDAPRRRLWPGGWPGLQNRCEQRPCSGGFDSRPPPLSRDDVVQGRATLLNLLASLAPTLVPFGLS